MPRKRYSAEVKAKVALEADLASNLTLLANAQDSYCLSLLGWKVANDLCDRPFQEQEQENDVACTKGFRHPRRGGSCSPCSLPAATQFINSPYDPEARLGKKRSTLWTGYKIHLTETCEQTLPHLMTHEATTPAPRTDEAMTEVIKEELSQTDLLPGSISLMQAM